MIAPTTSAQGVLRNSAILAVLQVFQMVAGIATTLLLAWMLDVGELAHYGAAFRVYSWLTAFAVFLLPAVLVRYTAELLGREKAATAWRLLEVSLAAQGVMLVALAVAVAAIPSLASADVMLPVGIAVVAHGFTQVLDPFLRGWQDFAAVAWAAAGGTVVRLIVLALLLALGGGVYEALVALALGSFASLAMLMRSTRRLPRSDRPDAGAAWAGLRRRVAEYAATMGVGGFLSLVVWNYMEVFFLASGAAEQLAFYTLAISLAALPTRFGRTISQGLLPAFANLYGTGEHKRLAAGYRTATVLSAMVGVPICALGFGLAEPIFRLMFPAELMPTAGVFQVLMIPAAMLAVSQAGGAALPAMEGHRFYMATGFVLAPVALALNWLLLPAGGAVAAAWINVVMQGAAVASGVWYLARRRGLPFPLRRVAVIAAGGWLCGAVAAAISSTLPGSRVNAVAGIVLGAGAGLLANLVCIRLAGVLGPHERAVLGGAARLLPPSLRSVYTLLLLGGRGHV